MWDKASVNALIYNAPHQHWQRASQIQLGKHGLNQIRTGIGKSVRIWGYAWSRQDASIPWRCVDNIADTNKRQRGQGQPEMRGRIMELTSLKYAIHGETDNGD